MKIKFYNSCDSNYVKIPIICISYETDENGRPIDIVVYGTKDNIHQIINEYALGSGNCRKAEDYEVTIHNQEYLEAIGNEEEIWVCLFARLPEFEVVECHQVIYK